MTKLKLFFMLSMLLGGLLLNPQRAAAQTEAEFEAEFNQYASNHTEAETLEYVFSRLAGMTTQAIIESEIEEAILDAAFDFAGVDCNYAAETQICRNIYYARLSQLTGESAVLAAACAVLGFTPAGPWGAGICLGAVTVRHIAELRKASFRTEELLYKG